MGRHSPQSKEAKSVYDLIAEIEAEDAVLPDPDPLTAPIRMNEEGSYRPAPAPSSSTHFRWTAVGVSALAATSLLVGDDTAEIVMTPVAHGATSILSSSPPVTGEQIRTDLSALQASRAEREAAQEQAQALQAEADRAETERRAEEARQQAAEEAELARQRAAEEEATREAQRAAQEAAERVAEASTGRHRAEAAQEAQQTVESPSPAAVSADGPGAIVPGGQVSSVYGERWGTFHYGVDVAGPLGTPIYSPVAGNVLKAGPTSGFGNAIYIEDSDGTVWLFGHMKVMNVSKGDHVLIGDQIAKVGNEGQSTGPHVHIERHVGGMNGTKTNPARYLGL